MGSTDYDRARRVLQAFSSPAEADPAREKKRLRIVGAATELFIQQGYRKTSVDEIARRASVAKGTVYLYFKTKGEILLQAIVEEKKRYISVLEPILAPGVQPDDRFRRWLQTAFVLGTRMPLISRLMSGNREIMIALDELPEQLKQQQQLITSHFITEMVDQAAAPHGWSKKELEERASVVWGLVFFTGLIANERVRGGLSVQRFAEILAEIVVTGLCESKPVRARSKRKGGQT